MPEKRQLKISVFIATSVDGYISRPDGDIQWLHDVEQVPEGDDAGYGEFTSTIDVLVMGSGSFEKILKFPEKSARLGFLMFTLDFLCYLKKRI